MDDNKKKALAGALTQIERQFGKGAVMRLGDTTAAVRNVATVSTGSPGLDIALGIGGLPRGRVTEIYGPESSGKTTLALQVVAEVQKTGGCAALSRWMRMPIQRSWKRPRWLMKRYSDILTARLFNG